jgi:leucyl aminopeptidase
MLLVPNRHGKLAGALFGLGDDGQCHPFVGGKLARVLPKGDWHIETSPIPGAVMALAFGMGAYRFESYRKPATDSPRLVIPADADAAAITRTVAAVDWRAISSTRRPMTWDPTPSNPPFARLAKHYGKDRSASFPATSC